MLGGAHKEAWTVDIRVELKSSVQFNCRSPTSSTAHQSSPFDAGVREAQDGAPDARTALSTWTGQDVAVDSLVEAEGMKC